MSQQAPNHYGQTRPTPTSTPAQPAQNQRPRRALINRDDLNQLPTVKGRNGGVDFIVNRLGVPMTPTRMRAGIERRELPVYKISGANFLAERDLYDWILSLAKTGNGEQA